MEESEHLHHKMAMHRKHEHEHMQMHHRHHAAHEEMAARHHREMHEMHARHEQEIEPEMAQAGGAPGAGGQTPEPDQDDEEQ
jgi:hypothetical protein